MTELAPLARDVDNMGSAFRTRGRLSWAAMVCAAALPLALIGCGGTGVAGHTAAAGTAAVRQAGATVECPRPDVPVRVVRWSGETLHAGVLPSGFQVTDGTEADLSSLLTYAVPGAPTGARIELSRSFSSAPAQSLVSLGRETAVTVHGGAGVVGPGAGAPNPPGMGGSVSVVAWHETGDVVLSLTGLEVASAELLKVANGVVYGAGSAGPEVLASRPGTAAACRVLPAGALSRSAMLARAAAPDETAAPSGKLVRASDLAAVDSELVTVDCVHSPCPADLLVWVGLTPVRYQWDGLAAPPSSVVPGGPGWRLGTFDAHTGVGLGSSEQGYGAPPTFWTSLVDFAP